MRTVIIDTRGARAVLLESGKERGKLLPLDLRGDVVQLLSYFDYLLNLQDSKY